MSNQKGQWINLFWGLSSVEALLTILYLLQLPADPKNAVVGGLSLLRLVTVGFLLSCAIICGWLAWLTYKTRAGSNIFVRLARGELAPTASFYSALIVAVIFLFPLIFVPPVLSGARIERIGAVLAYLGVVSVQWVLALLLTSFEILTRSTREIANKFIAAYANSRTGAWLLCLSFLIGLGTAVFTYYNAGDEGDALATGWLISTGRLLYKDIFSHHFPLSYFWVGLVTWVFGPSALAIRISLLIFRTVVLGLSMRYSRYYLLGGLTAVAWSLIGPLYLGNMLLYYSFDAILITGAFFVVFSMNNGLTPSSPRRLIYSGVLVGLAVSNDPVMVFPGVVILLYALLSGFSGWTVSKEYIRSIFLRFIQLSVGVGLVGLAFLVYLLVSSTLSDFVSNGIFFNTDVYQRYSGELFTMDRLLAGARNWLGLFNPDYRRFTGLYYSWESNDFFIQWIYTSFFFRLSIFAGVLLLLLQRKWLSGLFVYMLAVFLHFRGANHFHSSTLVLFALSIAIWIILEGIRSQATPFSSEPGGAVWQSKLAGLVSRSINLIVTLVIGGMLLWLNIRIVEFWFTNLDSLRLDSQFRAGNDAGYFLQATCHHPDARILVYPLDPGVYFFSQIPPASKYLFMTPWVAEIGQQQVIQELPGQYAVVFVRKEMTVWNYPVKTYMKDLIAFLGEEYIQVETNTYISPELKKYCDALE